MRQCRPISPHISPYLRRGRLDATVRTPPNTPSRETSAPRAPPPSPRTSWPHLLPQLTRTRLQSRFPSLPISAPISPYLAVTLCARAAPASSQRRPRPTPPPGESRRISANLGESRLTLLRRCGRRSGGRLARRGARSWPAGCSCSRYVSARSGTHLGCKPLFGPWVTHRGRLSRPLGRILAHA